MKLLVAYSRNSTHVSATHDYLMAFKNYWPGQVDFIHVTNDAVIGDQLDGYDVVLHNYCARLCFEGYVSEDYKRALRAFRGIKILSVQDEYDRTGYLKQAIRDLNFDVVLTCVPDDQVELIYPRSEFPGTRFVTVLTGYMNVGPSDVAQAPPLSDRPIVVGYRGRNIGLRYGRLGFDKYEIGRKAKEICRQHDVPHDISMSDEDRIYGPDWGRFIRSCRAMLGSESGSNVFDFDGKIEQRFAGIACDTERVEDHLRDLAPIEARYDMGQVSPRVFECVQNFTPLVLYEGRYSDVIEPGAHYLPLKKDFSNFGEILTQLEDLSAMTAMAERAFDHVVRSGKFHYRTFVENVFKEVEARREETGGRDVTSDKGVARSSSARKLDMPLQQFPSKLPKTAAEAKVEKNLEALQGIYLPQQGCLLSAWDRQMQIRQRPEEFFPWVHSGHALMGWGKNAGIIILRLTSLVVSHLRTGNLAISGLGRDASMVVKPVKNAWMARRRHGPRSEWLHHMEQDFSLKKAEYERMLEDVSEIAARQHLTDADMHRLSGMPDKCVERIFYISERIIEARF